MEKLMYAQGLDLGIICPIFKKGDMKKVTNYCGISLLDTAYRVLYINRKNLRIIVHTIYKYDIKCF